MSKCERCGKEFFHKQSESQKPRFCGKLCSGKYRSKLSDFPLKNIQKNPKWIKNHFVSIPRGKNHWNWQGGIASLYQTLKNSLQWKRWRTAVFERDKYKCQDCGASGYLEPHHIIPIRSHRNKYELFNLKNGITLCRLCHQKTFWKEENFVVKYTAMVLTKG